MYTYQELFLAIEVFVQLPNKSSLFARELFGLIQKMEDYLGI